jgi:beta-lactamase regulating signal transducer with metallopeptidase domain
VKAALLVFCYALTVAWCLPPLLTRLTAHGVSPRLGLASWLAAMASVLASAAAAVWFLAGAAIAGWPGLARVVCRSVAGGACTPAVYRSAAFELALGAAAIVAGLAMSTAAWRYGRALQRSQRRTRAHGDVARIAGRRLSGPGPAVVVDAPQPVVYCVPGRAATIVVTSAALAILDPAQLTAVLAHERAHLAGRHHLMIALTRALAACLPAVPLFTQGPSEVARLTEMCADDAAARRNGRPALVTALLAMGTGTAVPVGAMAATACAVTARVQRLLEPPRRARHTSYGLALLAMTVLLPLASGLVTVGAGPLAAHGLAAL